MKHQNEQKKLKALVRDLERELSEGKSQVEVLEQTNERLREAERICQELADENRGLRAEITNWQDRFAASEGNQKQINALREQLDGLQAEYTRAIDINRELEEKLAARSEAGMISSSVGNDSPTVVTPEGNANTGTSPCASELIGSARANDELPITSDPKPKKEPKPSQKLLNFNWRSRAILAGAILVISLGGVITLGVLGVKMLGTENRVSSDRVDSQETKPTEEAANPVSTRVDSVGAPRVRGTFQTVRPAHVFSEPSENSALVAEIGKGVKLNVVSSRNGWLEIHSKHGRPPGFVRQEEAIRISSN